VSEKDIAAEIERRLTADPAVQDLLLELYGRDPRYRYWETPDGWQFHYTTERMGDGRFHSAQYQPKGKGARSGKASRLVVRRELPHATRKGAKARAYRLYQRHVAELKARNG
jgi:hypothetical protein